MSSDDHLNVRMILSQSGRNEGTFPLANRIVGLFSERLAELERLLAQTESVKITAMAISNANLHWSEAVIVVEGEDEVLMNRYQKGERIQAIQLVMVKDSGSWQ